MTLGAPPGDRLGPQPSLSRWVGSWGCEPHAGTFVWRGTSCEGSRGVSYGGVCGTPEGPPEPRAVFFQRVWCLRSSCGGCGWC